MIDSGLPMRRSNSAGVRSTSTSWRMQESPRGCLRARDVDFQRREEGTGDVVASGVEKEGKIRLVRGGYPQHWVVKTRFSCGA
jgi:hypothetical protein